MASVAKRPAPLPKWFRFAFLLGCTPGFKTSRCKKLLKVTMRRIKLLKGRREVQVRQLRRDVAQLMQLGQEENAESRLDRLWKEHSLLSAYIKTGEYCQLVKANLRNIAGQRECPMDLKEPLASLCFAACCCADLPELQEIRDIMVMKYGKDFLTSSAHELLPGEHVDRLFLDAFSTKQPLEVSKKVLLKGILAEYNVVQPRKPKPPCIDGGLQKTASSDCNISHKQQSRHGCASNSESCKQHPNLNALEQEKHNKSPKQIRHTTIMPTCGAFTEEHASVSQPEGDWERKGWHKKDSHSHFQVDTLQGGPNETDLASQDGPLRAFSHDRHGKEKSRNRLKASKRNSEVNQVGQELQHTSINRMSIYEKTGPDEPASEFMHGYGNTDNEKSSLEKEVKGFVSGLYCMEEHGDFRHSHAKHRKNKFSNEEYLAETKQDVLIAQPWKHGYRDEALSEDFNAHQMLQEGNYKKHNYVPREVHSRSNGKARSGRMRNEFENVQHEREQCHADSNHAETESKHYSRSNRKDRFANEFDNVQQERSPHRRNHHEEGGNQVDINHRFSKTLRPGKVAYEIDNWHSPTIGYEISPEEREPPNADWETHNKHISRSNGKSRPVRVTDELNNNQQERSPRRRNHHVEGETKIEINLTYDEKSRLGNVGYTIENGQPSPKGNGSLPDYVDDTHKVHREKRNKNHENAGTKALSGDHPKAHILQEGREQHVRKYHFEETQQEAWPERAITQSPNSHICAHDNRYDSKYSAKQRDGNLHSTENHPTGAKIVTRRDHKEARHNGSALEPCMDGEPLPGDNGHVRQKHRRLARKHNSDHANSTVKVLDGDAEPKKQERIAEEAVNGQTHWPFIPEDDSNYVAQGERTHFPQWHHQFDPKPKGHEGSVAVDARSLPQVHNNAHGMQKEQNYLEGLDEHEDLVAKLSTCERVIGNSSPRRFSKPPQRPPPPVPPYRVSSLPSRKPLNSPPVLLQRYATLETGHVRTNQEPHVHPKLPEYEDLVASFAALRNKPARPPT